MNLLLFLLIGIPVIEVMVLVKAGEAWGFWATVGALILVGAAGSLLARIEGLRAMTRLSDALARREMPGEPMLDAALIFFSGILLAIPGFVTDAVALVFLLPPTRYLFKRWLRLRFDRAFKRAEASGHYEHRFLIR